MRTVMGTCDEDSESRPVECHTPSIAAAAQSLHGLHVRRQNLIQLTSKTQLLVVPIGSVIQSCNT